MIKWEHVSMDELRVGDIIYEDINQPYACTREQCAMVTSFSTQVCRDSPVIDISLKAKRFGAADHIELRSTWFWRLCFQRLNETEATYWITGLNK